MVDDPSSHQTTFTLEDVPAIRGRFLALGLFNIILGIGAIVLPIIADYSIEFIIGLTLILAGFADAWHAMLLRSKRGYILSSVSSVLLIVAGVVIFVSPTVDFTSLYLGIAMLFWSIGAFRVGKGLDIRPVNNWPWVIASGLLVILFGFLILHKGEPISWALLSLLVGISLIIDGWSRMILFWVHT